MGVLVFASMAFFCTTILAYEEISVDNLRIVPNTDVADTNNISFAFEVTSPIRYRGPLTYDIELHWEEEVRGYSGKSNNYFVTYRGYYSRTCSQYDNLKRNGQTYQFSVPKQHLGSGPLYVNVSVSMVCNSSYYYYCYRGYCRWEFRGWSSTIRIASLHGSLAAFEVDLELWPEEECNEFDMAISTSMVARVLLSSIRMNTNTNTNDLGIYKSRYLCIRKNFVTMRGVIMKANNTLATSMRDVLNTWLSEHNTVVVRDREVGIRAGLCGFALSSVNDPVCGRGYPAIPSSLPPTSSKNTASNPQPGSISSLTQEVDTLKFSLVSVCFISAGLVIAVIILAAYILYRWRRKRGQRTGSEVVSFSNPGEEEDESANLVFREN